MKGNFVVLATAIALSVAGMGVAQAQLPAQGTVKTATKLVDAMRMDGTLDRMFQQITPLVAANILSVIEQSAQAPTDLKAKISDSKLRPQVTTIMTEEVLKQYRARFSELKQAVAKTYAARFTEADLSAALAFYQTPAGQHMIEAQPLMQAEMSEQGKIIGSSAGKEAVPIAIARIMKLDASQAQGK
jgi:hypothetical protein